jgi:hypothetical protein
VRRLVWTAIGAAGGIWAYRKGSELLEQAREQGVALTIQQVALTATQTLNQVTHSINERTAKPRTIDPNTSNSKPRNYSPRNTSAATPGDVEGRN